MNRDDRTILVGNGATAIDADLGKVIDSFGTVVRFSWFWVKGFEEKVGTRTDVWATTVADETRLRENDFRRIISHSWEWDPKKDKNFKKIAETFPSVEKTTREVIDEMTSFAGLAERYAFSTGAIVAWILLREVEEVTLHGFDWARGSDRDRHHYGDGQSIGKLHKPKKEKVFFDKLIEEGKIVFLKEGP